MTVRVTSRSVMVCYHTINGSSTRPSHIYKRLAEIESAKPVHRSTYTSGRIVNKAGPGANYQAGPREKMAVSARHRYLLEQLFQPQKAAAKSVNDAYFANLC